jgi:hypothetical protein
MPKIDYTRPEVRSQLAKWTLIQDCIAGQEQVKSKGDIYLPRPNASDLSPENKARFAAYLLRAVFYNVVSNTLNGLVGQVFAADPVLELPAGMEILEKDIDGAGVSLSQSAKKSLGYTLALGRCGVLTDFPVAPVDDNGAPRAFTREEIQNNKARPTILGFSPEQVINWRTRFVDGSSVLSLVVISKDYICADDGFELETDIEWRVLYLDSANLYVAEVWRRNKDPSSMVAEPFVRHAIYFPTDSAGVRLSYIPFTFIGSLNNNELPDKPPMYDMAVLNLAHYRNSADYEDSVYMVGQPTPILSGLTKDWVENVLKKEVQLGSRGAVPLPAGGKAELLQAEANGLVVEAMQSKERQMVALGAQLVQEKTVQRTLGEAKMEAASVASTLVQCAKNVAAAYQTALGWACDFYGADPATVDYQLSTDFAISQLTPEERKATLADWQGGLISWTEARYAYRQSGLAYLDDAKAKAEIDAAEQERVNMEAQAMADAQSAADAAGGAGDGQ